MRAVVGVRVATAAAPTPVAREASAETVSRRDASLGNLASVSRRVGRARGLVVVAARKKTKRAPNRSKGDGRATQLAPASVMGVEEDHRFEQFFYDEATTDRIMRFASKYERPLFLCNPSLAARAEKAGMDYLLLDRDPRWGDLLPKRRFRRFELSQPRQARFDYDAVFCDPPFANVALADLRRVVDLLAATPDQAAAPLWLAYPGDREEAVLEAFDGYTLERKPPALGYRSVKEKTQQRIFLYGPKFSSSRRENVAQPGDDS